MNLGINQICKEMNFELVFIKEEHYFTSLNNLLKKQYSKPLMKITLQDSIMVLCHFEDSDIDDLLAMLKQRKINIDYKAILTPYNQDWTILRLYHELKEEKERMK